MPHIALHVLISVVRQLWLVPQRCPAAVLQELSCWGLHATATGARSLFVPDPGFCCAQLVLATSDRPTKTTKPTGRIDLSIMTSGSDTSLLTARHAATDRAGNARLVADAALLFRLALAGGEVNDRARPRLVRALVLGALRGLLLGPAGAGEKRKRYQNREADRPNCAEHFSPPPSPLSDAECWHRGDNPTIIAGSRGKWPASRWNGPVSRWREGAASP